MIVSVRGILEAVGPDWVHLQVGGISLQISVPGSDINDLGPTGGQVRLFTHLRIRDDQPVLYGFSSTHAMQLFLMLNSVSGVGPRLSLALLSSLGVSNLQQAIFNGDIASLSSAPGVGRRTAGRIALELKSKIDEGAAEIGISEGSGDGAVIEALMALGYTAVESRQAVNGLKDASDLPVEERIRLALQQFGGGG
ncbi:MAG: Holliday junction branch migration protein RuvA [SAR202 cluster bacterium MP-SAtl-SRR3965592-G2]|nr:MAG: Holliday junction branch migration protein RuvA [SAR202 cluster bacterium MP-SAtl-SRR3965592-G2]HIM79431.1 Holliday junction branch migration protein RuvA [Dehalococcoidia bacterium]